MTKTKSGLILFVTGLILNLLGRLIIAQIGDTNNLIIAGVFLVWMVGSVVIALFGLFRLIVGFVSKL